MWKSTATPTNDRNNSNILAHSLPFPLDNFKLEQKPDEYELRDYTQHKQHNVGKCVGGWRSNNCLEEQFIILLISRINSKYFFTVPYTNEVYWSLYTSWQIISHFWNVRIATWCMCVSRLRNPRKCAFSQNLNIRCVFDDRGYLTFKSLFWFRMISI